MLQVTVNVTDIDNLHERLGKLGQKLYQFDAAMESIGKSLVEYYAGPAYNSQGGAFEGGLWPALSHKYAIWKAKHWGTPIMVGAEGESHMRDQFNFTSDATSVTVGNSASYFVYHQSTADRTRLPRREMIGVNDTVKSIINDIVEADIRQKLDSSNL